MIGRVLKPMIQVIGLSGKAGVGKDYIASQLRHRCPNSICLAFADQIKIQAMVQHGLSYNDVYETKTSATRQLLQTTGTEQGRNTIDKDIWLKYLHGWMEVHHHRNHISTFIITDVRFPNEIDFIHTFPHSAVYRVVAPVRNQQRLSIENATSTISSHASETALDTSTAFDHILYNDPHNDLDAQLACLTLPFEQ